MRKHYLDNIRWITIICVVIYHVIYESMVIGTSAMVDTEIDGAVGMNSGIFNNPFLIWGKYKKKFLKCYLPISFQFHHTQMDGAHAGRFLMNLQNEIDNLRNYNKEK